jgi:hypothetical protein
VFIICFLLSLALTGDIKRELIEGGAVCFVHDAPRDACQPVGGGTGGRPVPWGCPGGPTRRSGSCREGAHGEDAASGSPGRSAPLDWMS